MCRPKTPYTKAPKTAGPMAAKKASEQTAQEAAEKAAEPKSHQACIAQRCAICLKEVGKPNTSSNSHAATKHSAPSALENGQLDTKTARSAALDVRKRRPGRSVRGHHRGHTSGWKLELHAMGFIRLGRKRYAARFRQVNRKII